MTWRTPTISRSFFVSLVLAALVVQSGCAAWRDVTTAPVYKRVNRPRALRSGPVSGGDNATYRITDERLSIFSTVQGMPVGEASERIWRKQDWIPHRIWRFPTAIVEYAYIIVTSPLLVISYALALPVWYDTENDATFDMEPEYWEEYPWYWVTRGIWVVDFIVHDIPYVAVALPVRLVAPGAFEWKREIDIDEFKSGGKN